MKKKERSIVNLIVLWAISTTVQAAGDKGDTTVWQHDPATPGDWFVDENWTQGVPTSEDGAEIDNDGEAQILSGNSMVWSVVIGTQPDRGGVISLLGGYLEVLNSVSIAWSYGTWGRFTLDADLRVHGDEWLGYYGDAELEHLGGTHTVDGDLTLARKGYGSTYTTPNAVYRLWDGELSVNDLYLTREGGLAYEGLHSTGTFEHFGGKCVVHGSMYLGPVWHAVGTYNLVDGVLEVLDDAHIGVEGRGEVFQSGGTHTVGGSVFIGYDYGEFYGVEWEGIYDLSGGVLTIGADEHVGYHTGRGTFTQSAGDHTVTGSLSIGAGEELGLYIRSDGDLTAAAVVVGGNGTLHVSGGSGAMTFGSYDQSEGGMLVSQLCASGLSTVDVSGEAHILGDWKIIDAGAGLGVFDVLTTDAGITGSFSSVELPSADWTWGNDGTRLWVEHVASTCPADLNYDGVVDVVDLVAALGSWGQTCSTRDVTDDGVVDVLDLLAILGNWGPCE